MDNDFLTTVIIIAAICFLLFIIFSTMSIQKESFDNNNNKNKNNNSGSNKKVFTNSSNNSSNGTAGNAESFTANIQAQVIKLQDTMLLSKYRTNYENVIMALDDLVDNLMLKTALNLNPNNPQQSLTELVGLHNAKNALNHVMKFIDSSSS
jgi:hypothetical protein